uniref:Uncharacterized protein n=1 Tax=Haptolina brevifila TaxID=156173 RepID=A0A7S2ISE2_9EUKA
MDGGRSTPMDISPKRKQPRAKTERHRPSEEEEIAELRAMFEPGGHSPPKQHTTSTASSTNESRPKWNSSPLRNPPGALRGVRPVTLEPWMEVAEADRKVALNFGHENEWEPREEVNSYVEDARRRREDNRSLGAAPWDASSVKHMPPELRGQKPKRQEPWSKYHNDDISELNAVEGTAINELYAITEDRNNRVKPTIVQPQWDGSKGLGRPSTKPGAPGRTAAHVQYNEYRAKAFREARRAGAPAGGSVKAKARTARSAAQHARQPT